MREQNYRFIRSLVPYAEKFNINVVVENMWQHYDGRINYSTCADPEEHCAYVDQAGRTGSAHCWISAMRHW